tara:strand:+ start:458 stop:709 length:252 start_codon:yes stop_codon:yes gene_type:complete
MGGPDRLTENTTMNIEESQNFARQGIEALKKIYRPVPEGPTKRCPDRTTLIDFLTDAMHLLSHAETTRLFEIASDHWEEERAK